MSDILRQAWDMRTSALTQFGAVPLYFSISPAAVRELLVNENFYVHSRDGYYRKSDLALFGIPVYISQTPEPPIAVRARRCPFCLFEWNILPADNICGACGGNLLARLSNS